MSRRRRARGVNLPLVLAINLLLFFLFIILQNNLRQSHYRLSQEKHQAAAQWLAISGAELVEARLSKGLCKVGQTIESPQYKQGRFVVRIEKKGGETLILSSGYAASFEHTMVRTVASR